MHNYEKKYHFTFMVCKKKNGGNHIKIVNLPLHRASLKLSNALSCCFTFSIRNCKVSFSFSALRASASALFPPDPGFFSAPSGPDAPETFSSSSRSSSLSCRSSEDALRFAPLVWSVMIFWELSEILRIRTSAREQQRIARMLKREIGVLEHVHHLSLDKFIVPVIFGAKLQQRP